MILFIRDVLGDHFLNATMKKNCDSGRENDPTLTRHCANLARRPPFFFHFCHSYVSGIVCTKFEKSYLIFLPRPRYLKFVKKKLKNVLAPFWNVVSFVHEKMRRGEVYPAFQQTGKSFSTEHFFRTTENSQVGLFTLSWLTILAFGETIRSKSAKWL